MGREYNIYLQDCLEWGGDPVTIEEFEAELIEEKEVK